VPRGLNLSQEEDGSCPVWRMEPIRAKRIESIHKKRMEAVLYGGWNLSVPRGLNLSGREDGIFPHQKMKLEIFFPEST
jgi:hypothetical protein